MEESEKEQVPEFQSLAKCGRRNDQVGDTNQVVFISSNEDSPGRE